MRKLILAGVLFVCTQAHAGCLGEFLGSLFNDGTCPSAQIQSDDPEIITLAQEITKGITDDYAKARAVHDWVARNIRYDASYFMDNDAVSVLHHRAGVCQGYSDLTAALFRAIGIQANVIHGKIRYPGEQFESCLSLDFNGDTRTHAWNEVQVDGRTVVMDTTWDAPTKEHPLQETYFDPNPTVFAQDHLRCTETMD